MKSNFEQKAIAEDVKATYKEVAEIEESIIETQLEFASALVQKDITAGKLNAELQKIGETYLACHLLYMNYQKNSETRINGDTSLKKLTPTLGTGIQSSPYGQVYLSLLSDSTKKDDSCTSGVVFL